jgi:photosystem II stability/assembly factor-like uncharacterized protein
VSVVVAPPPVPLAVAFRDPARGVLGTDRTIELTADGGKSWRVALRTPRPVVSVWLFSGAEWARYDDGENLRSTDGGHRWAPAVVPMFPATSVCPQGTQQSYASDRWALCTTQGGAGSMGKSVYRLDAVAGNASPTHRSHPGAATVASRSTAIRSGSRWHATASA